MATVEERIKAEQTKLEAIFAGLDVKRRDTVQGLIENAAFMAVTLENLRAAINENGVVSAYQNGQNQWGTKKSPEVDVYLTMTKNFVTVIRTLCDMLPEKAAEVCALDDWIKNQRQTL